MGRGLKRPSGDRAGGASLLIVRICRLVTSLVVSGGRPDSVDTRAAESACACGLQVAEHLPDLKGARNRGESARRYCARNQIVTDDCDRMVAFIDPAREGGTEDTIGRAERTGKPVQLA